MRWFYVVMLVVAVGFAGANSKSYVVPAQSFLNMLEGESASAGTEPILTNDWGLMQVLNAALWLRGEPRRATMIGDDPQALNEPGQWILWSVASDPQFPSIRETQGYASKRSFYPAPSFVMPTELRPVRTAFTPVSVLRTGPYPSPGAGTPSGANVAPLARIWTTPFDKRVEGIADYSWLTAVRWQGSDASVTFDLGAPGVLSEYGFSGIYHRGSDDVQPSSWTVEGSSDNEQWTIIDRRTDVEVSASRGSVDYFEPQDGTSGHRFIRFNLRGKAEQAYVGLSDIEIYLRSEIH